MALQYVTVQEKNWAGGLDSASAPTAIPQGYVEDCVNMIPTEDGQVIKRPGYITVGGGLPFRVSRVETTATGYVLNFQTGISLENVRGVPLIVCGRIGDSDASHNWGDFSYTSDTCVYYTTSSEDPRRTVPASTTSTISLLSGESGASSVNILPQIAESSSAVNSSSELIFPTVNVNPSTYDVSCSIANGTSTEKKFFMYILDLETTDLSYYVYTSAGAASHTITQATHTLPNSYILVRCFDSGGDEIFPTITKDLSQTITITDPSQAVRRVLLVSCEDTHFKTGTIAGYATQTISLSRLTTPFLFAEVYVEIDNGAGIWEKCLFDSLVVDASGSITIATATFTNYTGTSASFIIYWTCVDITARISLTAISAPTAGYVDTKPALCVYGLDHETSYTNAGERAGHVVCVDNYKTPGEEHLIASIGGTIYKLQALADLTGSIHSLPTWYPSHRGRVYQTSTVGPAFIKPPVTSYRLSGRVVANEVSTDGYVTATSFMYDAAVEGGCSKITIPCTGLSTSVTYPIKSVLNNSGFADYLTITSGPYEELIGDWKIAKVEYDTTPGAQSITIHIDTEGTFESTIYDKPACTIVCGVFSDVIRFTTATSYFRQGDVLTSALFGADSPECVSWEGQEGSYWLVRFKNIKSFVQLPAGLQLVSTRYNDSLIQLQTASSVAVTPADMNIVAGDMLSITGYDRQFRVKYVRAAAAETVTVSGDGQTAYLVLTSSEGFYVGQKIALYGSLFGGVHTITRIVNNTTMQFASSVNSGGLAAYSTLAGVCVELDEAIPSITDSTSNATTISVHSRWVPIEAPYSTIYSSQTVTATSSSGLLLSTSNPHKLTTGTPIAFTTTNTLPTGLSTNTLYYVVAVGSNTFKVATSAANALAGTVIAYSDAGTGTHTGIPSPVNEAGRRTYPSYFPTYQTDEQRPIRSCMANGNMYFTNGVDFVMKYDGQSIMRAGLPRWQPFLFGVTSYDTSYFIQHKDSALTTGTASPSSVITLNVIGQDLGLVKGRKVVGFNQATYTGFGKVTDTQTTSTSGTTGYPIVKLDRSIAFGSSKVDLVDEYRYYFRYNYVDDNNSVILSAPMGSNDTIIYQLTNSSILLRSVGLPAFTGCPLDYNRLELEIYRTKANEAGPYYRVSNQDVNFVPISGYSTFTDFNSDDLLSDANLDAPMSRIMGSELATGIYPPPIAKYITSAANRLLLANLEGPYQISLRFVQTKPATTIFNSDVQTKTIILRKDNTSTSTTCNCDDVWVFEILSTSSYTSITNVTYTNGIATYYMASSDSKVAVGDWVYLARLGSSKLDSSITQYLNQPGWFRVVAVTSTTFSIEVPDSVAYSIYDAYNVYYCPTPGTKRVPLLLSKGGVSYTENAYQGQYVNSLPGIPALLADILAMAINSTQRMCSTSNLNTTFEPWVAAYAGGDYPSGTLVLEIPSTITTIPEVKLFDINPSTIMKQFVNGLSREAAAEVSFSKQLYPSRVAVSFPSFPEVFDNPYSEETSMSIADINPADGQEITGMIPLFSTSAFTASSKDASVVVFKERSIYILNPENRTIRRLETDGIGCRYPYSIAPTRGGIMFANEAGIFRLNYDLTVEMLGKALGDAWDGTADPEYVHGHHFSREQQYKISTNRDNVWVYNYRGEEGKAGIGGWSRYTNFPSTGWCNQVRDEFFGSDIGRVFKSRYYGDFSDYRDDDEAIDAYTLFKPMDFGEPGTRKQCRHFEVGYLTDSLITTGNRVYFSLNMNQTMTEVSTVNTVASTQKKADVRQYGLPAGRFMWLQLKVRNATIDEPLEVVSLAYRVVGLSDKRNPEAGN